jgi:hypothetical protein
MSLRGARARAGGRPKLVLSAHLDHGVCRKGTDVTVKEKDGAIT